MADAKGDVKLQLKADVAKFVADMKRAERSIDKFKRKEATLMSRGGGARQMEQAYDRTFNKMKRHFDNFDKGVKMMGAGLSKFLMTALKGTVLQMGLMGAAMLAIHGSFVIGRGLVKAYAGAMKILSSAGAAAAVAISTAAAAMREQQAAMFAFSGGGQKSLGSGLNQTRAAMRALAGDANLAVIGTQGLNKAYGSMAKTMSSTQIKSSRNALKALMDFGSAGQDPAAVADKVGAIVATLSDAKKGVGEVISAAKELGPQMEKALKDANIKTKDDFRKLLMSGELARKGGVFGQFDAVNSTLIGQAKTFFQQVKIEFERFGDQFLEPAKNAMQKIMGIIKRDLSRVYGELDAFGTDRFFTGLVTTVEKVSGFFVNLTRKWLPESGGVFSGIGDWMERFKRGWNIVLERLRPFIAGAQVLESTLKPIFTVIGQEGAKGMKAFNEQLITNAGPLQEFGERISLLIKSLFELGRQFREIFFKALPFINDILSGLRTFLDFFAGTITRLAGMFGGAGGFMSLMILSRQMKGTKGGFMGVPSNNVQTMNVSQMNVGGAPFNPNAYGGAARNGTALNSAGNRGGNMPPVIMGPGGGVGTSGRPMGIFGLLRNRFQNRALTPQHAALMAQANALPTAVGYAPGYGAIPQQALQARQQQLMAQAAAVQPTSLGSVIRGDLGNRFAPAVGPLTDLSKPQQALFGPGWRDRIKAEAKAAGTTRLSQTFRNYRGTAGYSRIYGNEAAGIRGVNQSMGARMGATLGLSMLSQYAPEEMRGSLALGSTVGMFNPMAGLAIGLGGAAMNAQGVGTGALAGAGAGATIGAMTGLGAPAMAVGAAIGTIGGAIMGAVNKVKKQSKEAQKAFGDALGNFMRGATVSAYKQMQSNANAIAEGRIPAGGRAAFQGFGSRIARRASVVTGMITDARIEKQTIGRNTGSRTNQAITDQIIALLESGGIEELTKETKDKMRKRPEATIKKYENQIVALQEAGDSMDRVYDARLKELTAITGKSAPEIEVLAQKMGVDLYDSTVKFTDVLTKLGVGMAKTADQMRQANVDVFTGALSFEKEIEQIKAPLAMDEIASNFKALVSGGGATTIDTFQFLDEMGRATLAAAGGNSIMSTFDMINQLGYQGKQGTAFGAGGQLAGVNLSPEVRKSLEGRFTSALGGYRTTAAQQINDLLVGQGYRVNTGMTAAAIGKLDLKTQERLLTDIQSGKFNPMLDEGGKMTAGQALNLSLQNYGGLSDKALGMEAIPTDKLDEVATKMGTAGTDFKDAVQLFINESKTAFASIGGPSWLQDSERPNWWGQDAVTVREGGDTSSPRLAYGDTSSRLQQTMSRHSALDSQLPGKRTVTSSFRTFGLGSMNSDHVTGRAYDLVGQNLGMYQALVRSGGGFAEFHGNGYNRHLHVVPGSGAYGDTSSMVRDGGGGGTRGVVGNASYVININGSTSSPEQIANMVLARIKDHERSRRERS